MSTFTQAIIFTLLGASIATGILLSVSDKTHNSPATLKSAAPVNSQNKTDNSDITRLQQTISELQQQLNTEQENRAALDFELQLLEDLLADTSAVSQPASRTRSRQNPGTWFNEDRLLTLNINPGDIETIKTLHNQSELEKLTLRNNSARDPKLRRTLYRELQKIDTELREELGEQNYDRMLFATGKNNRVEVTDILTGSAANQTDIQKGDVILSYGGERIYAPANLYQNTARGEIGEMTLVEVQRGQEVITVYVPRGPLGTRFKPVSISPR